MKHLTVDQIIDFVSFDKIDPVILENAATVNTHIRQCGACLRKVRAFQVVYDELESMGRQKEFNGLARTLSENKASTVLCQETQDTDSPDADSE